MKSVSLRSVREIILNTHPRTRKIHINTVVGLIVKGGGMLISLILVPLTIDYLNKETYGTWLTISSVVTMIAFFDIGIGNGLRNKFSEAISNNDISLARSYVSTAYFIFGVIQIVLTIIFLLLFNYIPWQKVFNTTINQEQLRLVVLIMAIATAVKLVLDILSYILFALQKSGQVSFINLLSNLLLLFGTYALTKISAGSLVYIGLVTALSPILVLVFTGFLLYKYWLKDYSPSYKYVNTKYAKDLLSLGYKFFLVQMCVIVLFYTDNIIISQLFGPSEVTSYNVVFRYFNSINTLFTIVVSPYWSAFTEAYSKSDYSWMKKTYKYLQSIWLGLVIVVIIMTVVAEPVYKIWIGNRVLIPQELNICMGIFIIVSSWNSITVVVSNGLGKVGLQLMYALAAAIVNIPLTIFFGKVLNMGTTGVVLATSVSLLIGSVLGNIQANKLLSGTARGIWNK